MRKAIFATLITFILVAGVLLIDRSVRLNRPVPKAMDEEGKVLPSELRLVRFPSKEVTSFNKFSGKVVLINFWASWCEACMAEMPSIQRLYDMLKDEGLQVLAINVDENPERVVPPIVDKLHLNFPIFTDTDGVLSQAFEVMAIPFSVIADRKQKIVWSESGERDWASEAVVAEVRKLLK